MATRITIIGGFLGAGKTALVNKIAQALSADAKTVGLIMNDQGEALVDTQFSKANGFDTTEVSRGCFCSTFNDLISSAREIVARAGPDLIIAEPVGSCTDLLATVVSPLKLMYPEEFEVAPLIVVVDAPRMAQEWLDPGSLRGSLRKHQVEEAECIVISKIDMVTKDALMKMVDALGSCNPQAKVIPYSAITGHGLDQIVDVIRSGKLSERHPVDIDQDAYATAEAELGWYNGTFGFQTKEEVDVHALATRIIRGISLCYGPEEMAHTKLMLASSSGSLKMSAVLDDISVDGMKGPQYAEGKVSLTINARVVSSPEDLQTDIRNSVFEAMESIGVQTDGFKDECFSPSRPNPTHRLIGNALDDKLPIERKLLR